MDAIMENIDGMMDVIKYHALISDVLISYLETFG